MTEQNRNDLLERMEEGGCAGCAAFSDPITRTSSKRQNASSLLVSFALISLTAYVANCDDDFSDILPKVFGRTALATPRFLVDILGLDDVIYGGVAWDRVEDAVSYDGDNDVGISPDARPNQPLEHSGGFAAAPSDGEGTIGISHQMQGVNVMGNKSLAAALIIGDGGAGDIHSQRQGEASLNDALSGAKDSGNIAFQAGTESKKNSFSSELAAEPRSGRVEDVHHQIHVETAPNKNGLASASRGEEGSRENSNQDPGEKPRSYTIFEDGSTVAHQAAKSGNVDFLRTLATTVDGGREIFHVQDNNGWQPLHEAAKGGYRDAVTFLAEHGVDLNARTNGGRGGSALWWAETKQGRDHPVCAILRQLGAVRIVPDDGRSGQI